MAGMTSESRKAVYEILVSLEHYCQCAVRSDMLRASQSARVSRKRDCAFAELGGSTS